MKIILKILSLLTVLFISSLSANIDECKSDLYYANGIMMKESEEAARAKWEFKVRSSFLTKQKAYTKIENIRISYNISQGFTDDILESFEQIMSNEWRWEQFSAYFKVFLQLYDIQKLGNQHENDLTKQVNSYKQSIKDGHGVVVIAHSQGNYFTNEAYELLDDWMKPYFKMMGVATPANHVAGFAVGDTTAPYVKFHNDFINVVITGLASNRDDTRHHGFPSIDAHDFYDSYLMEKNTKSEILGFVEKKVEEHATAPSQWQTDQEFERDTINYRITVKHLFDPNIVMKNKVYPFAPSKKLYQVNGEWVKASCGGENILQTWNAQAKNEFYLIDNPQQEKIVGNAVACTSYSGDPTLNGYQIVETACNYNIASGGITHVWNPVSGFYDIAGGSSSYNYFNQMETTYDNCTYYKGTVVNFGGNCSCYECRVFWNK